MAILDRMAIHESIGRLVIKDHMEEGSCYAWFNFVRLPRQVTLDDVQNLDTDTASKAESERMYAAGFGVALVCWVGFVASGFVFPPAIPAFSTGYFTSMASTFKSGLFDGMRREMLPEPRILSPPPDKIAVLGLEGSTDWEEETVGKRKIPSI